MGWQPVRFQFPAGGILLDVKVQGPICVVFQSLGRTADHIAVDVILNEQLLRELVHGKRPESPGRGQLVGIEMKGIGMFRAIQFLTGGIKGGFRIKGFFQIVPPQPEVGRRSPGQVFSLHGIPCAESPGNQLPSILSLAQGHRFLNEFLTARRYPFPDGSDDFWGVVFRIIGFPRAYADFGKPIEKFLLGRVNFSLAHQGIQIADEMFVFDFFGIIRGKVQQGGCHCLYILPQVFPQGKHFIPSHYCLGLFDIVGPNNLGSAKGQQIIAFRMNYLVDSFRLFTIPVWTCKQVFPCPVPGRPAADIIDVVGIHVNDLERIIPAIGDLRYFENLWLGRKIEPHARVECVVVGAHNDRILRSVQFWVIEQGIKRGCIGPRCRVHGHGEHHLIVIQHGIGIDVGFLGDLPGLFRGYRSRARLFFPAGCECGQEYSCQ